jgi:DNA replication protein DnaC
LENLAPARSSGAYLRYRNKLARLDVLILDDMGMRKLSSVEAQDLCEMLEEQSTGQSTVLTTQLPLDHWSPPNIGSAASVLPSSSAHFAAWYFGAR